jgi:hypothetical protein
MKVRHFGFMSPSSSLTANGIRQLIMKQSTDIPQLPVEKPEHPPGPHCRTVAATMIFLKSILPFHRELLDSG